MKLIVDENLLSFKVLEKKIFDYVCELGRQITQQILIQSLQKVAIKSIIGEKGNEKPVSKRYMAK